MLSGRLQLRKDTRHPVARWHKGETQFKEMGLQGLRVNPNNIMLNSQLNGGSSVYFSQDLRGGATTA